MLLRRRIAVLTAAGAAALLLGSGADVARAADSAVAAPVDVTGTVRTVVVDDVRGAATGRGQRPTSFHPVSQTRTVVEVGTTAYEVPADVARAALASARSGDRARITLARKAGARRADVVAAAATGRRAAAAPNIIGTHTLTVLPVYFSGKDSQTQASLKNLADLTAMFWSQQSGGKVDVQTSSRDWQQIASPSTCDYTAIANAAYAAHGITTPASLTNHYMIYFPTRSDCGWAGLAYVGAGTLWINGYAYVEVTAHEFGHNLGVGHANTAVCTSGSATVPWSSTCTNKEYNDWIDVMGAGSWANKAGNLNAALADYLGLATVTKLTAAGTATVAPAAQVTANRAVRVDLPSGVPVYVEYRPTGGNDFRQPAWSGVQVRQRVNLSGAYYPSSQLLDLGASSFSNPSLPQWAVWPVPGTGLAVKVTNLTADAATVSVVATNGDTVAPPAVTPSAPVAGSTVPPASTLAWSAPADTGGAGLASYALWVDGTLRTRVGAPTTTWTLPVLADGSHTVRVDATDNAGNTSTGATVTFGVSSAAPTGPPRIVSPVAGAYTGSSVVVSWSVDKATAAVVTVDGTVKATVASGTTSATVTNVADGAHTLAVSSRDSSGATTATSTTVAVTTDATAPTTPSGLVVTGGTKATWTASTDATSGLAGYRVSLDGKAATTVTSPSAAFPATDGSHTIAVTAVDRAGNTSGTATASFVRDATAPTGLTVTSPAANAVLGSTAVTLAWTAAADPQTGVTGYRVTAPGLSAPVTLAADATSSALTLPQGVSTLRLAAVNGAGGVQEVAVKVTVDSLAPAAATALAFTKDGTKLTWKWTKDAGTAASFRVVVVGGSPVTATGTTLPLTLTPGQHTATVTAVDAAGNTSSAASLTAYVDTTAPDAPVLLTPADSSVSGSRTVALTWTAPTDAESGLSGYLVTVNGRKLEPLGPSATSTSVLATADGKVTLTVAAVNGAGLVGAVAKASVLVDTLAPAAPVRLAATASGLLTWAAPADRGSPVSWRVVVDGGSAVTVTDRTYTVSAAGQHTVAVTAVDAAGNTSSAVSLTRWVDASAPGTPSGLSPATGDAVGTRTPTVSWTPATDAESGVAGYVVAVNGRVVATVGGDVTSTTVPVPAGAVTVTVTAVNLAGVRGEPASVSFVAGTGR